MQIITNNWAYAIDGDVYFSVDNFPNYGQLSGAKPQDNSGLSNPKKQNKADFALRKVC